VTGALDAFQWRVPVEALEKPDAHRLTQKVEELVPLGARPAGAIGAPGQAQPAAAAAVETPRSNVSPVTADVIDVTPKPPAPPPSAAEPPRVVISPTASAAPFRTAVVEAGPTSTPTNGRASVVVVPAPPDIPAGAAAPTGAPIISTGAKAEPARAEANRRAGILSSANDSQMGPAAQISPVIRRSTEPRILAAPHAPDDPGPKDQAADADPIEEINTPVASYTGSRKEQS
jgi:HemY protein